MIKHLFTRTKDSEVRTCMDREISPQEALQYFVAAELFYNSNMVSISDTEIRSNSYCFGSVDDMVFSGAKEEMVELVEIARAFEDAKKGSSAIVMAFNETKNQQFNADASAFMSDMASGKKPFEACLWHMLARKGAQLNHEVKMEDLHSAFELIYVDNQEPSKVFDHLSITQAT